MRLAAELGELDIIVILADYFGVDTKDIVGDDDKLKVYIKSEEALEKYNKVNYITSRLTDISNKKDTGNKPTNWVERYRQIEAEKKAEATADKSDKPAESADNAEVKVMAGVNEDGSIKVVTLEEAIAKENEAILKAHHNYKRLIAEAEQHEAEQRESEQREREQRIAKRRKEYFEKRKEKQKKLEEERLKHIAEMEAEGKIIEGEENRYKLVTDDVLKDRMNAGKTVISVIEEFSLPDRFKFRIYDRVKEFEKEGATFPKRRGRNK